MTMVPWIRPAAVLLNQDNIDHILSHIPTQRETLLESYKDSVLENTTYYVVAWRDDHDGLPRWYVTEVEFFKLKHDIEDLEPFKHYFTKI